MKTLFKMIMVICGVSLVIPFSSFAAQFDAPYYDLQEKNKDKPPKTNRSVINSLHWRRSLAKSPT